MATPINLKALSDEERGVLVESIPVLRNLKGDLWWQDPQFKTQYKKWLEVTNCSYKDGGFEQFKLGIHQMRRTVPLTYKINKDKK